MRKQTKIAGFLLVAALMAGSLACVTVTGAWQINSDPAGLSPGNDDNLQITAPGEGSVQGKDSEYDESIPGRDNPEDYYDEYDDEGRPLLSGPSLFLDTDRFRIHYTLEGIDAVPSYDFVVEVGETLDYVWQIQIGQFGWAPPPPDGQLGGNALYDVYLKDTLWDGTFGYVENSMDPHGHTSGGDNPHTPVVESRAAASFMVLDNDFANMEDVEMEGYLPMDMMRSTAAHEFNHSIQFGYDSEEPADWLWEATATWMQDEVFDDVNDGVEDLYSVFKSTDTCQIAVGGTERVEDEGRWYGQWIFLRHLSEQHGHEIVRSIWEHAVSLNGYAAIEAALQSKGKTLEETLHDFSVALLVRGFDEGDTYPVLRLEGAVSAGETFIPGDGVGQMAADYLEIFADGPVTITLQAEGLRPAVAAIAQNEVGIFQTSNNQIRVDGSRFDHLYLIVMNPQRANLEHQCAFSPYTVQISSGGQPQVPSRILTAPNFTPPEVDGLMDPDEIWGEGWQESNSDYENIQPLPELIPSYLPQGYEMYDSYLMKADDLGADAIWFTPGGGDLAVVDFYGPEDEDYLSASVSDNPYSSFDQFFTDVDWEPYEDEWRTLRGVPVIIEDYSDDLGAYSFATWMLDGQFFVVEGNLTILEMEKVVTSMLD